MAALYLARVRRLVMGMDRLHEAQMPDVLGGVLRICFEAWITGMWVLCVGQEAVDQLDADYVKRTNKHVAKTGMKIKPIPEVQGIAKLPEVWQRRDALEACLVDEGDTAAGALVFTYDLVYGGESNLGVHAGYASVIPHLDIDDQGRWFGVRLERVEASDGADKVLWAATLLALIARRVFLIFGFGVRELDELGAPLQRMSVLLNEEYAAQIAAEEEAMRSDGDDPVG